MTPWTPKKLANLLGVDPAEHVRQPLRERTSAEPSSRLRHLSRDDIAYVGEHNVALGTISNTKVAEVLDQFDKELREKSHKHGPFDVEPPEYNVLDHEGPVLREADNLLTIARNGGSVLTDHDVWTDANINVIVQRFIKQPDVSGADFFSKLDGQLADVDDDVRVLFAEIFLLQMLPIAQFRMATKIGNIERVLHGVSLAYKIPPGILEALESPVFGGGVAFATRRFQQLSMLIEFVRFIRTLSQDEWDDGRENPLTWRELVRRAPGTPEPSLRQSLTYLGHPDFFFPIVSEPHKQQIVDGFYPEWTERPPTGDVDIDLAALREWMSPQPGTTPDFYCEPLDSYWMEYLEDDDEVTDEKLQDADEYSVESIIEDGAFHSNTELRAIITRWSATKNVILQGPPGTGKTWLAKRLAFALIGLKDAEAVRSVQFHPGTSYEDFVRGWRPSSAGTLELVDGPLLQHANRARDYPDIEHVLIIEEFNRGNPAQALGEMLTLLENTKRSEHEALELTYMHEDEPAFFLPENLYVIGTMNTADRSLALVDFALRRRFAFFDLAPQLNDAWVEHLKDRFRSERDNRIVEVSRRVRAMNEEIASDPGLGSSFEIGHSFFVPEKEATEFTPWFRSVIESSVAPQLREYWRDDPDTVSRIVEQLLTGF